jgi:copper chaperone CopZ
MHCEGCAQGIKQASKNWTGVKSANVSFKNKRAFVAYDPKKTDAAKIAANFKSAGFPTKSVK